MTQPGSFGSQWPKDESWLVRKVQELEQTVQQLRAARTLEASSIGAGGLQVVDGGSVTVIDPTTGNKVMYVGDRLIPDGSGRHQMAFMTWRDDGTAALQLFDGGVALGHPHQQAVQWFDRTGHTVFADDTSGGQGIASPYLPLGQWVDNVVSGASAGPTTSATFVTQQVVHAYIQHPKFVGMFLANSTSAGTTGEICVLDPYGNQVGPAVSVPANAISYLVIGPSAYTSWNFQGNGIFNLQARRTGGTGSIGVRGLSAWGVQT